jgi:hypothetical protein
MSKRYGSGRGVRFRDIQKRMEYVNNYGHTRPFSELSTMDQVSWRRIDLATWILIGTVVLVTVVAWAILD